jgi:hypothetical protein
MPLSIRGICGEPMPKARNGADRGVCVRPANHTGHHGGSNTCPHCGVLKTQDNSAPATWSIFGRRCTKCETQRLQVLEGREPRMYQMPGELFTFRCGCVVTLPMRKGESDRFSVWVGAYWKCRIQVSVTSSTTYARAGKHVPMDSTTPHSAVRKMMDEPCVLCGATLDWGALGSSATTPHLDHNHLTGRINGYACAVCNPLGLKKVNRQLRRLLEQYEQAA